MEIGRGRLVGRLGVHDEPHTEPEAAHLGTQLCCSTNLHVHRAGVRSGVPECLQVIPGVGHHQVTVEEHPRAAPDRCDDGGPDGDVGHEMAIHHVHVQPVGHSGDLGDLGPERAEIG